MTYGTNHMVLDCTLRDGGYVNNWEFDTEVALNVRDALYESGIRYIELGLVGRGAKVGKQTKFASFAEVEPLLIGRKEDCHYALMLTQAEYEASKIEIPSMSNKTVDIIRLAFFKPELDASMETVKELMSKGYTVFLQAMATFLYTDAELIELIEKVNQIHPASFYMVDSFSTMYNDDVRQMKELVLSHLSKDILFGFHAHNNIQMAYSNVIEFLSGTDDRAFIVDGSIYGMGRGAGNAPVELIMEYLNKKANQHYDVKKILLAFEQSIEPIFQKYYWGYAMPYYLTASKNMNSVYAWYLGRKGIRTIGDFDAVLDRIPEEAKYTLMQTVADEAIAGFTGENNR